jgi:cysteine desulfuration protein SufE
MSDIREIQQEIVEEFSIYEEWMDKYNYLIEISRNMPLIDDKNKISDNLISGCQSRVWLNAEFRDGRLFFTADSDSIITKGIIALLIRVFSERAPREILDADLNFIEKIGLKQNLSPTRANGLLQMIKQMRLYAVAYSAKANA